MGFDCSAGGERDDRHDGALLTGIWKRRAASNSLESNGRAGLEFELCRSTGDCPTYITGSVSVYVSVSEEGKLEVIFGKVFLERDALYSGKGVGR